MVKKQLAEKKQKNPNENKKKESIKKSRGRPKGGSKQEKIDSDHSQDNFENIQTAIIQFFSSIGQSNLVFDQIARAELQKLYPQKKFNQSHKYDARQESNKVDSYIEKLEIVKYFQENKIKDSEATNQLKNLFLQASALFASEITSQLYEILSKTCDIVFQNRNNKNKITSQLRKFGDSIPSPQMQKKYFYFGFHMFKLPKHKNESNILNMRKHYPHYKYILLSKYRQPEGPYADFIEKVGDFVLKIIKGCQFSSVLFE